MAPIMEFWNFGIIKEGITFLDSLKSIWIQRSHRLFQITVNFWIAQI